MRSCLVFVLLQWLSGASALAQAHLVFFEKLDRGKVVQLEPGGRFFHVALQVEGGWIHAHPFYGVEVLTSLAQFAERGVGRVAEILVLQGQRPPSRGQIKEYVGKPYDSAFRWESNDCFYCSELVRKILGMGPALRAMLFTAESWQSSVRPAPRGFLGASPDDDFREIRTNSRRLGRCERATFVSLSH